LRFDALSQLRHAETSPLQIKFRLTTRRRSRSDRSCRDLLKRLELLGNDLQLPHSFVGHHSLQQSAKPLAVAWVGNQSRQRLQRARAVVMDDDVPGFRECAAAVSSVVFGMSSPISRSAPA